ncbi:hypothetical protein OSTOST_04972 [Ostertagia ostertagi]
MHSCTQYKALNDDSNKTTHMYMFTLHGLGILTPDELVSMGLETAHAYCIYSTLKARKKNTCESSSKSIQSSGGINIYVAQMANIGGELVYKMVHLRQRTKEELYSALRNCNAIRKSDRTRMFYVGPAGIKVEMSDEALRGGIVSKLAEDGYRATSLAGAVDLKGESVHEIQIRRTTVALISATDIQNLKSAPQKIPARYHVHTPRVKGVARNYVALISHQQDLFDLQRCKPLGNPGEAKNLCQP